MPLTPGSKLGTYQIIAPLGAGGMGEVFRARDPRLGREIAVKVRPRSDLWALGVLMHEMASGSLPFRGTTSYELAAAIMHDTAAALPDRVPPGL